MLLDIYWVRHQRKKNMLAEAEIKDDIRASWFDMTTHLFFHKRVSLEVAERAIQKLDKHINKKMLGRNFTADRMKPYRLRWVGFLEDSDNGNKHCHLLIKFPQRERVDEVKNLIPFHFKKIWKGGSVGEIQENYNDIHDEARWLRAWKRNGRKPLRSFSGKDIEYQWLYYTKNTNSTNKNIITSNNW